MRRFALIAVLSACGSSAPPPAAKPQPQQPQHEPAKVEPAKQPDTLPYELTAKAFCELYEKSSQCSWYAKIGMDHERCLQTFGSDDPDAKAALKQFGPCLLKFTTCDDIAQCFASTGPGTDDLRACDENKPEHAVGIPADEWNHRKGAGVTKYSEVDTTKASPVEVCGVAEAENQWLANMTCNDGSHPLESKYAAESVRVGNVGAGGRCGSIIDLYRVKCPERSYDIYIDGYVCPRQ
ncbi:MAG TPA: hypothetical protein VMJ10_21550 [Kofleriaceae bacterium]|nr:hypothetical protein [Kofleriaceae bacterium]